MPLTIERHWLVFWDARQSLSRPAAAWILLLLVGPAARFWKALFYPGVNRQASPAIRGTRN